MSGHNHITRDIKPPGGCPACDKYHLTQVDELMRELARERAARRVVDAAMKSVMDERSHYKKALEQIVADSFNVGWESKIARDALRDYV